MALQTDITELRLRIKDPLGVIAIVSVADATARLAVTSPARQTTYKQLDTGDYWIYDADLAAWEAVNVLLSDTRLGLLIDLYGVVEAIPHVYKEIVRELGPRLSIVRTADGAGSTEYTNLLAMYDYYKKLTSEAEEEAAVDAGTSTGRYFRTHRPHIAGGMHG